MALKAIETHGCGSVNRNAGILKTKQIELTARTSAPSDSDLADARIYYNSTDEQLYLYAGSEFLPLSAGMRVTNITATVTLTAAEAGLITVNNEASIKITLPSADSKGLRFSIVKQSSDAKICAISAGTGDVIWKNGVTQLNDVDAQADTYTLVANGDGTWFVTSRYVS